MRKQLSPMFAIIVILVAIALGALYFLSNYRTYEARWRAESEALQAQAERGRSMRGSRRGAQRTQRARAGGTAPGGDASQTPQGGAPGAGRGTPPGQ